MNATDTNIKTNDAANYDKKNKNVKVLNPDFSLTVSK